MIHQSGRILGALTFIAFSASVPTFLYGGNADKSKHPVKRLSKQEEGEIVKNLQMLKNFDLLKNYDLLKGLKEIKSIKKGDDDE